MRVLVLNTMMPFIRGGAETLAEGLLAALQREGAQAELLRIPFTSPMTGALLDEMLAARSMRLGAVDRVIGLKFPTYLVQHPDKVMWLVHQYRQAYDLYDTCLGVMPGGAALRDAVRRADDTAFAECRGLYAIAANVAARLQRHNGFEAGVLHMPLDHPERFGGGEAGSYVFAAGRLADNKRQALMIRAMRHVRADLRLVVAGPPDFPHSGPALQALAEAEGVADRVRIEARYLADDEVAALVNGALAVAYVPHDEDAIGYVTMEACQAAKPVIACTDSGGLLELLQDGVTGFVVPPEPEALGQALDRLAGNRALARQLGLQAREVWLGKGVTWPRIVQRLLA
jgi:glycosyltransferase involved in cell wall biosynthesis